MTQSIVIITGQSASGKTTLGKKLSSEFKMVLLSKDAFKDRIFDKLGIGDKEWSHKVSATSHKIMDYIIHEELSSGHSVIVESNFKKDMDSKRFSEFQAQYGCKLIQISCWAQGEVLYERFVARMGSPKRHPGHVEEVSLEEIRQDFIQSGGREAPLDINGSTIELDTTHLDDLDYSRIYELVKNELS